MTAKNDLTPFLFGLFLLGVGVMISSAQVTVHVDTFENGSVTNSDAITGFWTLSVPTDATITESGGKLNMTAGSVTSPNGVISPLIYSGAPREAFNFFKRPLRFTGNVSISGTVLNQCFLRFSLTGATGSNYTVDDALVLLMKADNTVTLSTKQDRSNTSAESVNVLVNGVTVAGAITGFDLTLDAVNYTLVVYFQGGTGSATYTGAHGLVAAQWGIDGKSTLQFETVRASGGATGAGQIVNATIDNFTISSLAPVALFEDSFGNGSTANSDLESSIWTHTLPFTSTALETAGSLVQTATAADTSFVVANASTPVQSRFNFFNQQLKISATVTVTGSAAATWMERGRLVLASQKGTSGNAPDSIMVGFRGQNNITLVTKTDTPYVEPDNVSNTANKFLLAATEAIGVYSGSEMINRFDLLLNDKRFQLIAYNPGKGCGILRFSGAHGIDRSKWGAAGDSALILETIRTSAAAGTTAVTTWDDVRVESSTAKILEEPFWNFTATYSTSATGTESGPFYLWLPSTEPVIRGIIFIAPGDGDDCRYVANDLAMQEAARAMGFGLIGYYNTARMNLTTNSTIYIKQAVQTVLDRAAEVSGHPELSNAVLCITGLSRGGFDSCYLVRNWPERVVAFVPHCGAEWSNPTLSAAAKKVPGLFMPGSGDYNSATDPYVMKTNFGWWRSQGAQVAYAPDWGVGHTMRGNQGWEATLVWMVEVAKLRYPRSLVPSRVPGTFPTLVNLDETSGWLGDNNSFSASSHNTPTVTSAFMLVAPYGSYSGTVSTASWMPNEATARMYRAMTSTDYKTYHSAIPLYSPLRIVSPAQFSEPVVAGTPVTIEVDPREFDNTNIITSMEFYDGATWLGTVTSGPAWQWTFTPTAGAHHLSVVATDALGNKRDAFRAMYAVPSDFAPLVVDQVQTTPAATVKSGTVAATDPEGKAVTYSLQQATEHGILTFNAATGAYVYQPAHGFSGTDSFTFKALDGVTTGTTGTVTFTVGAAADTNADGIPDAWATQYGVTDPNGDSDHDGMTNLQEYLADTNPNDANDNLRITDSEVTSGAGHFTIHWAAKGGVRYRLQYSDDLKTFTDIPRSSQQEIQSGSYGADTESAYTDDFTQTVAPTSGKRFYRVKVAQP